MKSLKHIAFICIVSECLISFLSVVNRVSCQDFGYEGDKGPSHWGEQYNTCVGKYQSPIDINSLTVKSAQLPALKFTGFDVHSNQTMLENNGHTVMLTLESDNRPTIRGGSLSGSYEFAQLHFHWGENDTFGSEDLIDGQSFPMELHMVFYKKQYRNVRSAMENSDGLCVLAFFFHLTDNENANYAEITELLSKVSEPNTFAPFKRMQSIRDLILADAHLNEYYTYHGSLTTPPCSEVVTWIDFKQSIPLSHAQIEVFRTIQDGDGHRLTHNFRPTQPIGDRDVYFVTSMSYPEKDLNQDNQLEDPPQDLDSLGTSTASINPTQHIDQPQMDDSNNEIAFSHNLDHSNELKVETTTPHTRKLFDFSKNDASHSVFRSNWLYIGCSILFAYVFI